MNQAGPDTTGSSNDQLEVRGLDGKGPLEVLKGVFSADNRPDEGEQLDQDVIFDVLYNRRRRQVIRYLLEHDQTATTSDLAEAIAAEENDVPIAQLSSSERKRVYVGLYQNHLPKLDDVGVIDYDKHRGTITLCDTVHQFTPYLGDRQANRTRCALPGVAIGMAGLIVIGAANIGVLAAVPNVWWVVLGLLGVSVMAFLHFADLPRSRDPTGMC